MSRLRYALVLVLIALVAPGTIAAWATSQQPRPARVQVAASGPASFNLANIQFALEKGDNATPIAPSTRFKFGTRRVWAFWSWDNARPGQVVKYTLRFGQTDVAWGELTTDARNGRMEVELERMDGDYLMVGTWRLFLDASGGSTGDVRTATFEIYDDSRPDDDDDDNNDNGNDDGDDNDDGGDNDNGSDDGDDNDDGGDNDNRDDDDDNNDNG